MSTLHEDLMADVAWPALGEAHGETVLWDAAEDDSGEVQGTAVTAVVERELETPELVVEGETVLRSARVIVAVADVAPAIEDLVSFDSAVWTVSEVQRDGALAVATVRREDVRERGRESYRG
ncbi:MAG TPA: hypothetical protein VMZ50_00285 [Phycisphaerae bacterium]|nr:hypothetical protein [Phycisphaerae bacterium]